MAVLESASVQQQRNWLRRERLDSRSGVTCSCDSEGAVACSFCKYLVPSSIRETSNPLDFEGFSRLLQAAGDQWLG